MTFAHEASDFGDLVAVVAARRRLSPALVEKDYWVTHVLWGLHRLELEIWFKGGTSLSKGFGLIERFSEDLDLKAGGPRRGREPDRLLPEQRQSDEVRLLSGQRLPHR